VFTRELARRKIVSRKRLLDLLKQTTLPAPVRDRVRADIEGHFARR
jgi:hypothetical protein